MTFSNDIYFFSFSLFHHHLFVYIDHRFTEFRGREAQHPQLELRLAYSTLVRSATMTSTGVPDDAYTLAWYSVQLLVDAIRDLSPLSYTSQKKPEADNNTMKADDRTHRPTLMLISTYSPSRDDMGVDDGNKDEGSSQSERKGRKKRVIGSFVH